jgi:putative endonuclease
VYVLFSEADGKLYTGYTTDLSRRLDEHFQGRNTSTAPRRPSVLEYYLAKADAERSENYLKTAKGRRVLRLMLKDSLSLFSDVMAPKPVITGNRITVIRTLPTDLRKCMYRLSSIMRD